MDHRYADVAKKSAPIARDNLVPRSYAIITENLAGCPRVIPQIWSPVGELRLASRSRPSIHTIVISSHCLTAKAELRKNQSVSVGFNETLESGTGRCSLTFGWRRVVIVRPRSTISLLAYRAKNEPLLGTIWDATRAIACKI